MLTDLTNALRAAFAGWRRDRRHARDIEELGHMDDHLLADLGIGRGQIEAYVRGTHRRDIAPTPYLVARGHAAARVDLA